jgi:hypothetical protein
MTHGLFGLVAFLVLIASVGLAFWQGLKIKPDRNNRDNWERFGGPPDNHDSHGF